MMRLQLWERRASPENKLCRKCRNAADRGTGMTEQFQVGVIAGTHGVRGDVKVFPTTDDPKRFRKLKSVFLTYRNETTKREVSNVRLQGKFVILHLSGIETPEEARLYRNLPLMIDRKDAVPLPEGRWYIPDLIGMKVLEENGSLLGTLTDVLQTGANDVYEVRTDDGDEILIPAIYDCILDVKPEEETMVVHLLPGLRELQKK